MVQYVSLMHDSQIQITTEATCAKDVELKMYVINQYLTVC